MNPLWLALLSFTLVTSTSAFWAFVGYHFFKSSLKDLRSQLDEAEGDLLVLGEILATQRQQLRLQGQYLIAKHAPPSSPLKVDAGGTIIDYWPN